jgi:glycosyltransferase involved in cell wall biosynthesis
MPERLVLRVISRLNVGGPARQIAALARGLSPLGWRTLVASGALAPGEESAEEEVRAAGAEVVRVPGLGRAPHPWDDLRALASLAALLRARRPALVHTHASKGGALGRIAAALASAPRRVHAFHGHVIEGYFAPALGRAVAAGERLLASLADAVVCLSPRQREDLVRRLRAVPRERAVVIPPGIDLAPLAHDNVVRERGRLRAELGLSAGAPLLGVIGRLAPVKAVERALEAFSHIRRARPDAALAIAGEGTERAFLEGEAARQGVAPATRFLGHRRDRARLYADLDLLLVSSRNEGTPIAALEAMAAGVPVVAFAVGGLPDIVPPSAGALVPPGDAAALAAAAHALLADPTRRAALAAAAPSVAARYSEPALATAHAALYERLHARPSRAP